jgi:hypothetical protein
MTKGALVLLNPDDPNSHAINIVFYSSSTSFSFIKRKFRSNLKARRFLIQMKEITGKMIVCNLHKFLLSFIAKVFYRAKLINYWYEKY